MAIEYALTGDFVLDGALKDCLLSTLGGDAKELPAARPGVVFRVASALVSIVGVYTGDSPGGAMLFFRVLEKELVVEATTIAIACVAAVLEHLPNEEMKLWMDEILIMKGRSGRVRVIEPGSEKPRIPFWNDERRRVLGVRA